MCSISIIREMCVKTTEIPIYNQHNGLKFKSWQYQLLKIWSNRNSPTVLVGMQIGAIVLENSLAYTISSNSAHIHMPQQKCAHSSVIHNGPRLEISHLRINSKRNDYDVFLQWIFSNEIQEINKSYYIKLSKRSKTKTIHVLGFHLYKVQKGKN